MHVVYYPKHASVQILTSHPLYDTDYGLFILCFVYLPTGKDKVHFANRRQYNKTAKFDSNFFNSFMTTVKSTYSLTMWKNLRWKSLIFTHFKEYHRTHEKFSEVYMHGFEDAVSTLDWRLYRFWAMFRSIAWSLFTQKNHQTWSNDYAEHDRDRGVSLSIV